MIDNTVYLGVATLSKIVETNDFTIIGKYKLQKEDFLTTGEQEVFEFINSYAKENSYNCPSPELVSHTFDTFDMQFGVGESFEYLVKNLKAKLAQRKVYELLMNEAGDKFSSMGGGEFIDYLQDNLENIRRETAFASTIGVDAFGDVSGFIDEYKKRKSGESFKVWKSAYPSLPDYLSGNVYCFYGRSGRGKSMLTTIVEAVNFAMNGATVLIWSLELSSYEVLSRIYSHLSARERMEVNEAKGIPALAGFEINGMLSGTLEEVEEDDFHTFLKSLNTKISGKLIVRGVDDSNFYDRSCRALEADILELNPDVLFIDPPYLMDLESNRDKTTGGAMAATSQKIRQIAGIHKLVLITITQADEIESPKDGKRELTIPKRSEIKKSKAFLEDSSAVYGLDTCGTNFEIEVSKGRNGGEGTKVQGVFMPSIGVIYEPKLDSLQKEIEEFGF